MVSKSIKTFQKTLKTARLGRCIRQDSQVSVEPPYAPEGLSWRPGHCPLPSEDTQNWQSSEDVQVMAETAPPGLGPVV